MFDVIEQLERYGAAVERSIPTVPLPGVGPRPASRLLPGHPRWRRPWAAVAAVSAVLMVAIGITVWLMNRGLEQSLDTVAPPTTMQVVPTVREAPTTLPQEDPPATTAPSSSPPQPDQSLLGSREGYMQTWTGRELVVLGGRRGTQQLADGAAYDPATGQWRRIASPPRAHSYSFVAWTGTEVVVGGGHDDAVDAYDPALDRWRQLPAPPMTLTGEVAANGYVNLGPRATMAGARIAVWAPFHSHGAVLDPKTGNWEPLAPSVLPQTDVRVHWTGEQLIVVAERTGFPISSTLVGAVFDLSRRGVRALPELTVQVPLQSADGSRAGQLSVDLRPAATAWNANRLLAWGVADTTASTARAFNLNTFRWEAAPSPKLASCEGFSGAINIGERILFLSSCDLDAALYHPDTNTWEELTAFRHDFDTDRAIDSDHSFWTGTELIGWYGQLLVKQDNRLND